MGTRVFHYSQDNSHKFWSIQVEGSVQTVRFGRIGTGGQTARKEFATANEAQQASERLIQAKLKKGYAEVTPEEAARTAPRRRAPRRQYQQLLLPF